jgi:tetratricopeptide (TPR) repeat protein
LEKPRAGEKTTKERIHRLKSVLEGDPASVAFFPLSKVLYSAGAVDEAVQVLERGLSYHPEFVAARLDLAHIYHQTGRDDNAINQLEKAVSLDLYNANALKDLAVILLEQGFKKEAVRYLSRLQELDPENEQYQEWMEKATSETEPEAVTMIAETPQPPTTSEFNTLTMVDIYMKQGLWKKAAEVLKAIIACNPDNKEAQQKLAEINAELDKMQTGEPEEEPKPSKTSWEAEETVPLSATGTREKDTAELLLDKWEEFRDLIATSGASTHKPEIEEKPVKPLITDEELERFAASIANITQEEGLTAQPRSEEMDWEGIVTAEETPSIRLESGYEAMAVDYSETQPSDEKPEPTTDLSSLPRIEDFAPLEVKAPVEMEEAIAPIPIPIVEEEARLEDLTSPELLPSPDLVEMVAHAPIPPIEEAPFVEELPAPELAPIPVAEDETRLEELTTPEIIPTSELEELIAPAPTPDVEELSALEELSAPELLPSGGLAEFAVPAPIPQIVEEPRLEELTAPETLTAPELDDLTSSAPPPTTDETFRLEDLTAPEMMASPSLEALEEPVTPPPAPLEDIVPPEEALTLEGPPSLDEIIRPPEPPKTDKLESIDDLLGTTSTTTLPAPPPPAQAASGEEFPEFEDWLDRLKDQNA